LVAEFGCHSQRPRGGVNFIAHLDHSFSSGASVVGTSIRSSSPVTSRVGGRVTPASPGSAARVTTQAALLNPWRWTPRFRRIWTAGCWSAAGCP
jgi:hypothetical protein